MFLFRSDHFFRGRFAYGFGQSLTSDAVPGREKSVVYSLSGHSARHRRTFLRGLYHNKHKKKTTENLHSRAPKSPLALAKRGPRTFCSNKLHVTVTVRGTALAHGQKTVRRGSDNVATAKIVG